MICMDVGITQAALLVILAVAKVMTEPSMPPIVLQSWSVDVIVPLSSAGEHSDW